MPNEEQLIERYRKASRQCTPNLSDSPLGVALAILIGAQAILESLDNICEAICNEHPSLKPSTA